LKHRGPGLIEASEGALLHFLDREAVAIQQCRCIVQASRKLIR